jgi:hypothetical protein
MLLSVYIFKNMLYTYVFVGLFWKETGVCVCVSQHEVVYQSFSHTLCYIFLLSTACSPKMV